ncbi:MAG: GNAT family N-acetyltransferase [Planctomycetota bacterium]|jgi:aminoglycoside 6'-N-acetyltransferase I
MSAAPDVQVGPAGPDDADAWLGRGAEGAVLGFAELSVRSFAEGCRSDRVGYLEGWYVLPAERGRGVGRALVEAACDWARDQGCTEFASDTELDNRDSQAAHGALGFAEVGRLVLFRREL